MFRKFFLRRPRHSFVFQRNEYELPDDVLENEDKFYQNTNLKNTRPDTTQNKNLTFCLVLMRAVITTTSY